MIYRWPSHWGRTGLRQLVGRRARGCASLPEAASVRAEEAPPRGPSRLRQVALLVAYHGDQYYGMELLRNSGFPTVEEALFTALRRSGAVAAGGAPFPPHYSRASRTDRGVSALGQVVSLRMRVWDGVLDDINCHLPADIRVCSLRRVPPRFSAQTLCDDRLYSYTLPTFAFTPMEEPVSLSYRVPECRLREVRQLLRQYVGSHSFHSFSPGGDPNAAQMTRSVMSVEVDEPYLTHGLEFTNIWIRGRSFVLSQIRRMVGLAVAVCRGAAGRHAVTDALGHRRLTATTAPGLGLILRRATFETVADAPWNAHGPVRWGADSAETVSRMERRLMEHIYSTEAEHMVTFRYLDGLLHNRIGVPVRSSSRSRSPLGYALTLTLDYNSARKTDVTTVTPGPSEVTEVTPDPSEVTEVTPEPSEVTKAHPDPSEVTKVEPDSLGVTKAKPDPSEVTEVTPDPSEVTKISRDPSEVTKAKPDPSDVTEAKPDPSEVTEVKRDPSEVTTTKSDPSEVATRDQR
ncbi:tRNA pseudouridine synthase A [Amphibalanus amphitrite]|uniref:tRNA pseudouridine synthase A n=1 Tax=Amphibalanus amphitrite TaxID=1232801 RepID=A0A6A4X4L5_AMPAM|nr:tRNA pseudouridine synthase A [Amphibalanus amphitrite]